MHHILELSLGEEYISADGTTYKVTSNFSEGSKLYVELKVVEPELIPEKNNESSINK